MADALFEEPRLAELYDPLDPDRSDLNAYVALTAEFNAGTVLDIGCGTGTLACLLAQRGVQVTAADPAAASLAVARRKPGAEHVRWLHADARSLPPLQVDLVTMTANVAQVFLTDQEWAVALRSARQALRPSGRLVFESRDPARAAWLEWTRDQTYRCVVVPGVGPIETRYGELGLGDAGPDELIEAMTRYPELIQRPVVIWADRAVIARPPELLLPLLETGP
jgi:ubiquinone/menaquinone biosynthesis C-methylase UbiE